MPQLNFTEQIWLLPRTIFSHSKSRAHQRSWSQRTSPRTTSWFGTRCWTTCLKPCSDSQGKQCYRFCQQIPIWRNRIIRPVPSAACVALQIRRTSMFSQIALLPWTVTLFDTTTFSCCSPSGFKELSQATAPCAWISMAQPLSNQSIKYFNPWFDRISFSTMLRKWLCWNLRYATNQTFWNPDHTKWTNTLISNLISIPSFLVITFNCTQLKFQF